MNKLSNSSSNVVSFADYYSVKKVLNDLEYYKNKQRYLNDIRERIKILFVLKDAINALEDRTVKMRALDDLEFMSDEIAMELSSMKETA